jgi:hypothetical protein
MPEANPQLIDYINKLTELTAAGKISWARANPTVFIWAASGPPNQTQVTLQEVQTRVAPATIRRTYLFQIQGRGVPVAVDSKEKPDYQQPLQSLYQAALASVDVKTADLLKDLLDKVE